MAYERLNLKNGTVVDEAHISHIEDGIVQNESDITELSNSLADIDVFGAGTVFPSGADLNDYMTPGKYYANNNDLTRSLVNCPATGGGCSLYVLSLAGPSLAQITQILFINNSSRMFFRYLNTAGTGSWVQVNTTEV